MEAFTLLFAAFLQVAVTTAPPTVVNTPYELAKTCVYITSQEGVPLPKQCYKVIEELNACSNALRPFPYCLDLVRPTQAKTKPSKGANT